MREPSSIHVFVDGETGFPVESFKLSGFGFDGTEIRGEPGSRPSEVNRAGFDRSE